MSEDGSVLFVRAVDGVYAALAELGYARGEGGDVEGRVNGGAQGVAVRLPVPKGLAFALGRRVARATGTDVRVLTVHIVTRGSTWGCELEDRTLRANGGERRGPWADEVTDLHGQDWDDICDGKSYFAVSSLMELAVDAVLEERSPDERVAFRSPPSLGSTRLDQLASQIRAADRAELTTIAGRACVRVTSAGATVTAFLDRAELERVRSALGPLLA